ncbi:MAG: N-acetyltransferase [Candidatus Acidiferrales bacterium]
MKIVLRDYAAASDFEALHEIDKKCFEPAIAYSRGQLREYLALSGADCVVAEAEGKIAGFLVAARKRRVGYIVTIDVLKLYRRAGVGTLLLAEAERRLAAAGAREVELETATDNDSAIAFWEKHGYRTGGVMKSYYPNGRDAFSMSKQLA